MNINNCLLLIFICACQVSETRAPEEIKSLAHAVKIEKAMTPVIDSTIELNYLLGKFDPAKDERFVKIAAEFADRDDRLLRTETYEAFKKMHVAAKEAGVQLKILSATRNFNYQKGIWERKWKAENKIANPTDRALKILEYSSMPGTSRHHWGTDIDLNSFDNNYFAKGQGQKEYEWLKTNAGQFGFCQPYTANRKTGYQEERWHWSYLPLAKKFTEQAGLRIKEEKISGFLGAEQALEIGVVNKYIMGINEACLK